MPTVLRKDRYRFFFFSNEGNEPAHIHIESGSNYAKFWLEPIQLARSIGFADYELYKIERLVIRNKNFLRQKWYEYFNTNKNK